MSKQFNKSNTLGKVVITAFLFSVLSISTPPALAADEMQQRECFDELVRTVAAVPAFSAAHEQLKSLTYEGIKPEFSEYYANISSFGIDLRSPDFDLRIYSFGRDTGYQHPPFSPFPTDYLSDEWKTPAKEYIIAEEYVRNTETNEHIFLSCSFMAIESAFLDKVTAERYLTDGPLSSVRYTSPDQNYKVWYSNNVSYDHKNIPFVGWRRIFVYPKATVNEYFDRYSVADAFPARITNNLGDIRRLDAPGHTTETRALLDAPELKGYDTVFALNSYYQTIENTFPAFSEKLALRGILQYDVLKELLATRGVSEFSALWNSVLDPRDLTKYALKKEKGTLTPDNNDGIQQVDEVNPFYEEQLEKIKSLALEKEAQHLLDTVSERNPIVENAPVAEAVMEQKSGVIGFLITYKMLIAGVIVVLLGGLLFYFRKKRQEYIVSGE